MLKVSGFLFCLTIFVINTTPIHGFSSTGPCTLQNSIDRQYITGLDATCTGSTTDGSEECSLAKGESFTTNEAACDGNAFYANGNNINTLTGLYKLGKSLCVCLSVWPTSPRSILNRSGSEWYQSIQNFTGNAASKKILTKWSCGSVI